MDPILVQIGPLAIRWYGLLIATGVLVGTFWAVRLAKERGLDPEKLLDMVLYIVIAAIIGARLVYVLTSPSQFFGPNGNPLSAFYIWEGGISFHGGVLGGLVAMAIYARIYKINMWSYADVAMPAMALGIMGGRIGNFMNGSDTGGRLTNWPVGFTWPQPGTQTFGAVGRVIFGENLWAGFPGVCSEGSYIPLSQCLAQGGDIIRGPVHLTQFYGFLVGFFLLFIVLWTLRRSRTPGYTFWQAILWYSVLRTVIEEPFRDNPLTINLYLADGLNQPGLGLFTLTQLASIPIILVAIYMLIVINPDQADKQARISRRARGR